ncbi:MAG: mannitol dehydrogenase family protein [Mycobacterium sp.]
MRHPVANPSSVAAAVAAGGAPDVAVPGYDRTRITAGIAHLGVGNFHRVHQGVYLDDLMTMRDDHNEWGIVGIGLRDHALAKAKARSYAPDAQDGLYTVTLFTESGRRQSRIVGSMVEYLHGPDDPAAVVRRLADPAIRIVSLTITEGGYHLDEDTGEFRIDDSEVAADLAREHPETVFGVLTKALAKRRVDGTAPFTVMSCDNLRGNGDTARTAVLGFAAAVDSVLAQWIATNVTFPNSMVDRIAPTVSASMRDDLNALTGLDDHVPALTEEYRQWVLQDHFPTGRPAFEDVGVQMRQDVEAFEAIKGRLLNASHMLLAYAGVLSGHRTVADAASDPSIANLLVCFMSTDAAPLLAPPPDVSLADYQSMVVGRFANANVPDTVLRVAHDGAAKLPVFHRATATGLIAQGRDPRREALLLAAFRRYLGGIDDHGDAFEVHEPHLSGADRSLLLSDDPLDALRSSPFASWRLADSADFVDRYTTVVAILDSHGIHAGIAYALSTD